MLHPDIMNLVFPSFSLPCSSVSCLFLHMCLFTTRLGWSVTLVSSHQILHTSSSFQASPHHLLSVLIDRFIHPVIANSLKPSVVFSLNQFSAFIWCWSLQCLCLQSCQCSPLPVWFLSRSEAASPVHCDLVEPPALCIPIYPLIQIKSELDSISCLCIWGSIS